MMGRLAPGAKVEPEMPGFDISVSVSVSPRLASSLARRRHRHRHERLVGDDGPGERKQSRRRYRSGRRLPEADSATGNGAFDFLLGALTTGLGVVTTTAGSSTTGGDWADARPAPRREMPPPRRCARIRELSFYASRYIPDVILSAYTKHRFGVSSIPFNCPQSRPRDLHDPRTRAATARTRGLSRAYN